MSILFQLPENIQLGLDALFFLQVCFNIEANMVFTVNNSGFSFKGKVGGEFQCKHC